MDVFFLAKIAHPESRQVTQITETALRSEGHALELVFEEVGLIGDLEWSAIVLCTANDDECRLHLAVSGTNPKTREGIADHFPGSLPPIGENADAGLETEIDRIDDHAVGSRAGDGQEEAFAIRLLERSGQAECDVVEVGVDETSRRSGNVPREIELLRKNVGGAAGEQGQWDAIAVTGCR